MYSKLIKNIHAFFIATNAKERQEWVARLRAVVDHYTSQTAKEHPPLDRHSSKRVSMSLVHNISNNINKFKGVH